MTDGTETTGERLRAILAATAAAGGEATASALGRVIAVGWATVELDRAARELAGALGSQPSSFGPTAGSEALGAYAWSAPGALDGDAAVILLEPSTEGRLAAHLARHGEHWPNQQFGEVQRALETVDKFGKSPAVDFGPALAHLHAALSTPPGAATEAESRDMLEDYCRRRWLRITEGVA